MSDTVVEVIREFRQTNTPQKIKIVALEKPNLNLEVIPPEYRNGT